MKKCKDKNKESSKSGKLNPYSTVYNLFFKYRVMILYLETLVLQFRFWKSSITNPRGFWDRIINYRIILELELYNYIYIEYI